jgi:hypothetical protein
MNDFFPRVNEPKSATCSPLFGQGNVQTVDNDPAKEALRTP